MIDVCVCARARACVCVSSHSTEVARTPPNSPASDDLVIERLVDGSAPVAAAAAAPLSLRAFKPPPPRLDRRLAPTKPLGCPPANPVLFFSTCADFAGADFAGAGSAAGSEAGSLSPPANPLLCSSARDLCCQGVKANQITRKRDAKNRGIVKRRGDVDARGKANAQ
jgi:hypothetical protein